MKASGHVEGTTVFPNRLIPVSGSSAMDVAYVNVYEPDRFQVYMDDESLLQSEINHCLFDN